MNSTMHGSTTKRAEIDQLLAILNRGDRFNLLDGPSVPAGNLNNLIHPIFHHNAFIHRTPYIRRAIQLASLFLTTDPLLEFYLPITFGKCHKEGNKTYKTLRNRYEGSPHGQRNQDIAAIKQALECLASHCLEWRWERISKNGMIWARTQMYKEGHDCSVVRNHLFKRDTRAGITIDLSMLEFYLDEQTGYITRSRCDQIRYDFHIAITLCHEIAHAYGAMTHGTLNEPWLARDHSHNELGWVWENFMFGGAINPSNLTGPGIGLQMYHTWRNTAITRRFRGLEWTPLPVAWTAQWFRRDTWDVIEKKGHLAVPFPEPELKIWQCHRIDRYIVYTNDEEVREDLEWGRDSSALSYLLSVGNSQTEESPAYQNKVISRSLWIPMTDVAKHPLLPTPQRHPEQALVDEQPFQQNRTQRNIDIDSYMRTPAAKKTLKRPRMVSVAAGLQPDDHIHVEGFIHVHPTSPKRLSVAGGPMGDEWNSEHQINKYMGLKPDEVILNTPPTSQSPSPILLPVMSSRKPKITVSFKRTRDDEDDDEPSQTVPPSKKARRFLLF